MKKWHTLFILLREFIYLWKLGNYISVPHPQNDVRNQYCMNRRTLSIQYIHTVYITLYQFYMFMCPSYAGSMVHRYCFASILQHSLCCNFINVSWRSFLHNYTSIRRFTRGHFLPRMLLSQNMLKMGQKRNAYMVLVGKFEEKSPLRRPRHRWENNIKMDFK